ncbi:MAG: Mammalian cell entry related domain protein [Mycobacterium sp.]|nr:Mammalian cell entry related domain protein [Mycobacterium sp.]
MLIHRASEEREARILTAVGMGLAICVVLAVTAFAVVDPLGGRPSDQFGVVIESPYVGEGVVAGTALLMHGVKVGEVTQVSSLPGGGVRLAADLRQGPTAGLTDAMGIDFRPSNYFGVTGINLVPGDGGQALVNGSLIRTTPSGNFTLQALLSRLGALSHGVLTPHLIDVIQRTTEYTDGLDPLLETMLVVSTSLANVQKVSTAQLLTNATGISVAFPGFVNATTDLGDNFVHASLDNVTDDFFQNTYKPTIAITSTGLFGAVGTLVSKHSTDLAPLTDMIKILTDVAPGLVPSDDIADTAVELRTRLQRLFAGPPDQRAVNVRVMLDSLPGVAAPIEAVGGPQ